MKDYFLSSVAIQPPGRWCEAFPEGGSGDRETLLAAAEPPQLVWLPTGHEDWDKRLAALVGAMPQSRFAVVSMTPDEREAIRALDAGARAYCHAYATPELYREVALVVGHGGLWVGPELMAKVIGAARRALPAAGAARIPSSLSARESEVARAVSEGLSNKEIADRLGITERTVKAHLGMVFEKLGVRDRLQLVLRLSEHPDMAGTD